jgi:hypothetical protein
MALVANSFLKVIPIAAQMGSSPGGGLPVDSVTNISRQYTNRVEKLETVSVYFNGQLIPGGETPYTATSRFYYEITNTLTPGSVDLGAASPPADTSTIRIDIKANTAYTGVGYGSGTSTDSFTGSDGFTVSYYYVVYTVA